MQNALRKVTWEPDRQGDHATERAHAASMVCNHGSSWFVVASRREEQEKSQLRFAKVVFMPTVAVVRARPACQSVPISWVKLGVLGRASSKFYEVFSLRCFDRNWKSLNVNGKSDRT